MRYNMICRFFIALAGVLALVSCRADLPRNGEDPTPIPDGMKAIEVRVQVQNQEHRHGFRSTTTGSVLRAVDEEPGDADKSAYGKELNENKIGELDLFLFRTSNETIVQQTSTRDHSLIVERNGAVTLRILVPADKIAEYEHNHFTLVVVANAPETIQKVQTLGELRKVVKTTELDPSSLKAQDSFLMDGTITVTPSWTSGSASWKAQEPLLLKRAAAKIRLRIKSVEVKVKGEVYKLIGNPKVRMQSYTNKTFLVKQDAACETKEGEWKDTEAREMTLRTFPGKVNDKTNNNDFYAPEIPFYAYENDWSKQSDHETYLIVEATFKAQNSQKQATYYYRVPVNFQMPMEDMTEEQRKGIHRLQRNHLYDVVTYIALLGSEDPSQPLELESNIAIQPWNEPDAVDGSIRNAHYLVVKELAPIMPNTDYREIVFASDLPIEIKIDKTWYEYYDEKGDYHKKERTNSGDFASVAHFDGTTISTTIQSSKRLVVKHPIPDNFVPYEIEFTVRQIQQEGESTTPLSQKVHVIQYPPKYVTGQKSPGFAPTAGEQHSTYADFRFQNTLGVYISSGSSSLYTGTQSNDVFYRITTIVPIAGEEIGDPTDPDGRTRQDEAANRIVSPEFILASQCGMSVPIPQYSGSHGSTKGWSSSEFGSGYGPYSRRFPDEYPYDRGNYYYDDQRFYRGYSNAIDRCDNYFEGEYGKSGSYTEHYIDQNGYKTYRTVHKKFKYEGRWRIPTLAEMKYIENIQRDPKSAVKSILWGRNYWTAQLDWAYSFTNHQAVYKGEANVRCVFDTYKVNDK